MTGSVDWVAVRSQGQLVAESKDLYLSSVEFRNGSEAAPDGKVSAIAASRHEAELPWTQISGEFGSQFDQKPPPFEAERPRLKWCPARSYIDSNQPFSFASR
jgi:hypothetical protein